MKKKESNSFIGRHLKHLTLIDVLFMGYMFCLSIILLFFHKGVEQWQTYIIIHFFIIGIIFFLIPALDKSKNKILKFIRWWYPILLFTFNYREINSFTHIIVQGWKDKEIMLFEKMIFGVHPTLWMEKFVNPVLTEIMKFDYFTYYFMIPVGAAFIYFGGRRKEYVKYLSTVCLAFYISYIGFILYPVRGPRYTLYDKYNKDYKVNIREFYGPYVEEDVQNKTTMALKGYFFSDLQNMIMRYGSLHGGCMPSSHIAVAYVCMMMMFFYCKKISYFYLPLVSVLCISVVYNRYHYVSDVAAGIIVGLVSIWITPYLLRRWTRISKPKNERNSDLLS
ncbi:MAG: phosphatase PAP2 family protein [Elusimicrobiota bacterium]